MIDCCMSSRCANADSLCGACIGLSDIYNDYPLYKPVYPRGSAVEAVRDGITLDIYISQKENELAVLKRYRDQLRGK